MLFYCFVVFKLYEKWKNINCDEVKIAIKKPLQSRNGFVLAQAVRFELTCRLLDKRISSASQYDHFGTPAYYISFSFVVVLRTPEVCQVCPSSRMTFSHSVPLWYACKLYQLSTYRYNNIERGIKSRDFCKVGIFSK